MEICPYCNCETTTGAHVETCREIEIMRNTRHPGDTLPNGATVVAAKAGDSDHIQILLCVLDQNPVTPYATWINNLTIRYSTGLGHYHKTLDAALEDFKARS